MGFSGMLITVTQLKTFVWVDVRLSDEAGRKLWVKSANERERMS